MKNRTNLKLVMRTLFWAACAVANPGHAQTVAGVATAADGDSLVIGGQRVRLFGIDAPELAQTCQKDGSEWSCGSAAQEQLAALVAGQRTECQGQGSDQHGRILAVCSAGGEELNRVLVEQGWALAYRQFSDRYLAAELHAKTHRLGIWSSTFTPPSEYRLAGLAPAEAPAVNPRTAARRGAPEWSGGCVIKGNRSRRGAWIYHLPGMPYYAQTRAEEWFCSEAEARAAGYRRAIVKP